MLLIDSITLVTDRGPGRVPKEEIVPTPQVTVFVGPNNCGKSLTLRELLGYLDRPGDEGTRNVVKKVTVRPFSSQDELVTALRDVPSRRRATSTHYGSSVDRDCQIADDDLARYGTSEFVFYLASRIFVGRLDGATRLGIVSPVNTGDLLGRATTPQGALFVNSEMRKTLRDAVFAATGSYLVIDPTFGGQLRFRLSGREPEDEEEEQGLSTRSRNFHSLALDVTDQGDGVKAYVGLLASVLATGHRVLLIDEPEAFLHPPVARSLAAFLCSFARKRERQLFLATHSEHVLMGCVDSGADVQIVRLSHDDPGMVSTPSGRVVPRADVSTIASARLLPSDEVAALMRDPLLRSSGAMAALFARGTVVVESAGDRAFYREIDYRLERASAGGTNGAVFLEAQNAQTIHRIAGPLRMLGVRAAAIVDMDVLLDRGTEFTNLLRLGAIPKSDWSTMRRLRDTFEGALRSVHGAAYREKVKEKGVRALPVVERSRCTELLDRFAQAGVFVVPVGELESWLPSIGAGLAKSGWVPKMLERLGNDDESHSVTPGPRDVWAFMRRVGNWLRSSADNLSGGVQPSPRPSRPRSEGARRAAPLRRAKASAP